MIKLSIILILFFPPMQSFVGENHYPPYVKTYTDETALRPLEFNSMPEKDLEFWLKLNFIPEEEWDAWKWMSWHESHNTYGIISFDDDGSVGRGLLQINSQHDKLRHCDPFKMYHPYFNIRCAKRLHKYLEEVEKKCKWIWWSPYKIRWNYEDYDQSIFTTKYCE